MSDNTKQKKIIRTRQQATGESYSTARMHVLRALPEREAATPTPAPTGFSATVARVIDIASAATGREGGALDAGSPTTPVDLWTCLLALPPAELRKIEVLIYTGRAGAGLRDVAGEFVRSTPAETVALTEGKLAVLAVYLRAGRMAAEL